MPTMVLQHQAETDPRLPDPKTRKIKEINKQKIIKKKNEKKLALTTA